VVDDEVFVRDLNSTNGTFRNGHRIRSVQKLENGDSLQFGTARFHLRVSAKPEISVTQQTDVTDDALAYLQFDKLMSDPAILPHFQPIVRLADTQRMGYEVLARSRLIGLQTPDVMFRVASMLGYEAELSRLMRWEGVRLGASLTVSSPRQLYLNTHPSELNDPELLASLRALQAKFPDVSMVLEIHEAAVTSVPALSELRADLCDLGIGLAYDDFGSGQARLLELADVPPDVIKFDIHLIRGLPEASAERRQLIRTLVQAAKGVDAIPLAEGIETEKEAEICYQMGFELAQGFYFGKPAPASNWLPTDFGKAAL
jgi:EAL domain-containing protein (putative c-di-GMP-specific phosphodiesterase class I)